MAIQTKKLTVALKPKLPAAPAPVALAVLTPERVMAKVTDALSTFAQSLGVIKDDELAAAHSTIKRFEDALERMRENVSVRLMAYVLANGEKATEKGTMRLQQGGLSVDAQPTRTGYDAKKVESMLRAKGLDPEGGMDTKITYVVNEGKLLTMVKNGFLSADELESSRYDTNYKLVVKHVAVEQPNDV